MNLADQSPISSSRIQENLEKIGLRIRYQGRVQGVGFRPTVWHLATKFNLTGSVFNNRSGTVVEIWGDPANLEQFQEKLPDQLPPIAQIQSKCVESLSGLAPTEFQIVESSPHGSAF